MKPGELVRLGGTPYVDLTYGNVIRAEWVELGRSIDHPPISGYFETGELAMVLEDCPENGVVGGCRVITSKGIIGWLNRAIPQQLEG